MLLLAVYLGLTHNTPQVWGYTYTHPLLEQSSWCTEDFKVSQREKEQCMAAQAQSQQGHTGWGSHQERL